MFGLLQVALFALPVAYAADLARRDVADELSSAATLAEQRLFGRVWKPKVGQQFQIVLSATVDTDRRNGPVHPEHVPIWDIDVFDNTKATITALKRAGKKVICYFSAGTSENWREDFGVIKQQHMGAALPEWPGERWLDIRTRDIMNLMKKRVRYAAKQGCDAIDPDNMDGYENEGGGGFNPPLTKKDTIKFMRELSRYSHRYGMAIGLKNSLDVLPQLTSYVEFAVNEECATEREACEEYRPFLNPRWGRGKPVFHIEYVERQPIYAKDTNASIATAKPIAWQIANREEGLAQGLQKEMSQEQLRTRLCALQNPDVGSKMSNVIKVMSLDGWLMSCEGNVWETRGKMISKQPKGPEAKGSKGKESKGKDSGLLGLLESLFGKGNEAKAKDPKATEAKGKGPALFEPMIFEDFFGKSNGAKAKESKGTEAKAKEPQIVVPGMRFTADIQEILEMPDDDVQEVDYQAILNGPDEPFDEAFDRQLEKELAGMDNTSPKKGAAKDRRGSPFLKRQP